MSLRLARSSSSSSSNDEINNPCKPGQRSFVGSLFERKRPESEAKEIDDKEELAVAAPSQQEDNLPQEEEEEKEDKTDRGEGEIEENIVVEEEPCCFILEQVIWDSMKV